MKKMMNVNQKKLIRRIGIKVVILLIQGSRHFCKKKHIVDAYARASLILYAL